MGSSNFGSIGRRVMKTRSGGPVHGLDDAGYEFGLHKKKSKISGLSCYVLGLCVCVCVCVCVIGFRTAYRRLAV